MGHNLKGGACKNARITLNRIANLIWGIADGVLEDLYVRGKYGEVIPNVSDACFKANSVKPGYENSSTRYFYKPTPMRSIEEIWTDTLAPNDGTESLPEETIGGANS